MFTIIIDIGFEKETVSCLTAQKVRDYIASAMTRHMEGHRLFHCAVYTDVGSIVGETYYYAHGILA